MTLFLVTVFCVAVLVQLHTISKRLEHIGGTNSGSSGADSDDAHTSGAELSQLKEELQKIRKVISGQVEEMRTYLKDELQCYNDASFAHDLRDQLREIPKQIVEQIETAADDVSKVLENQLDRLKSVESSFSSMETSLSNMESSLSTMEATLSRIDSNTES
jgi:archaellum component FlaC